VFVATRFRRRGLAQALLARALLALHGAGAMMVCLDVDPDSETGAMRVYERAGFRPTGVLALYQKQL
jgi:ribosomal protein S18 acetylase RimI-like enzyme